MEKIKEIFEENKITIVSCLTILILSFFLNVYMYYFINYFLKNKYALFGYIVPKRIVR